MRTAADDHHAPRPRAATCALRSLAWRFAASVSCTFWSCAEVLDIPEEPRLVGPWSCLGQTQGAASVAPPATALVRIQTCNFVSTNCADPVRGVTAALCAKKDVHCTNPIAADIHDVDGALTIEVPIGGAEGFDGFLSVTTPAANCTDEKTFGPTARSLCSLAAGCDPAASANGCDVPTFAPALLFFNPPVKADPPAPVALPLIPTAAIQPLIEAAGGSFDPSTGYVFMSAHDCAGNPAAGVHYTLSRSEEVSTDLYLDSGIISNTSKQTDASGIGGFLGVPAGFISVSGSIQLPNQPPTTIGEVGVQVARFTITYSTLAPMP